MEFLKSNIIVNNQYKPTLDVGYMEYFNRALVFAQTNYQEQIQKVINTQFRKISPTNFYEEYAWCVYSINNTAGAIKNFAPLSKELSCFYHSFWDLNNFPKYDSIKDKVMKVVKDENKLEALYRCADIMNRGIKLFGWDSYKDNYLNCVEKLSTLPMIGLSEANQLSRSIGVSYELISTDRLYHLAGHWEFESPTALCKAIQKHVPMQLKIIELILWYSAETFPK